MILLLDENLSPRLARLLQDVYPQTQHVSQIGLESASDSEVWEYVRQRGLILVSKDSDFRQRSLIEKNPPKFIWIRKGNCSTRDIEHLLRRAKADVEALGADPQQPCLSSSRNFGPYGRPLGPVGAFGSGA